MIRLDDVTVSFGDATVLDGVSLSVDDGTFVGLVGPNGAGKTTLLRTVSAALTPDSGAVTVAGDPIHRLGSKAASRRVAVVPQDTTVSFSFAVREVVAMGRTPHRGRFEPSTREDGDVVDDALGRVGATHLARRRIDELSGGERQKVVVARALAQETPVLLLDEPTASLDVNHQVETLELVTDLVADGKTVVAAIHDLSLAARYCDELALLGDGGLVSVGPPEDVLTRDRLAASFDAQTALTRNPVTDSLTVTAVARQQETVDRRVHLVGSGPTAARTLERLVGTDARVTVGPVAPGDALAEAARLLDVPVEHRAPQEPADAASLTDARARMDRADVVIVAAPALAVGDSGLFDALMDCDPLVVVDDEDRWDDHVPPASTDRAADLRRHGVRADPGEVVEAVARVRRRVEAADD
ncbi:ATP-binding cassette domain-containing protein [Haloarchaeobius sp. HRN-SO-5]|uniref:ATP-binding cassette domain-containing protein n=1 Tax=Haloarchaeobius sp. HRN-SO-5 TaxID=3446118 RepID=UPI003EBB4D53